MINQFLDLLALAITVVSVLIAIVFIPFIAGLFELLFLPFLYPEGKPNSVIDVYLYGWVLIVIIIMIPVISMIVGWAINRTF